jgi:hypothetical protein
MEATTTEVNRRSCAAGGSDPGRESVDLPVLEARPLRIAGASTALSDDHGSALTAPSSGPSARSACPTTGNKIASATSHCEKVALSDGAEIVFATVCTFDDVEAPASTAETCTVPMSLQRYQSR